MRNKSTHDPTDGYLVDGGTVLIRPNGDGGSAG